MAPSTAHGGEDVSAEEDSDKEQEETSERRRHVELLLDISEEATMELLQPAEYYSYEGLEEAVTGWARAHPISGIFVAAKTNRKLNQKAAVTESSLPATPPIPVTKRSDITTKHQSESHEGQHRSFQRSYPSNQHTGSCRSPSLQKDSFLPAISATQGNAARLAPTEREEQGRMLRETHHASFKYSMMENRPSMTQKDCHRPNSRMVPIKNFSFLPPLNPTVMCNRRSSRRPAEGAGSTVETHIMWKRKHFLDTQVKLN